MREAVTQASRVVQDLGERGGGWVKESMAAPATSKKNLDGRSLVARQAVRS